MNNFLKEFKQFTNKEMPPEEKMRLGQIEKAQESFWEYCKIRNPKFFTEKKPHLKHLADILQALYEGRIRKFSDTGDWQIYSQKEIESLFIGIDEYYICKKFILNIPPRHGKSYTLTLFTQWIVGKNSANKIITVSYNDTLSGRFSSNVRDGIEDTKLNEDLFVFKDIFPEVKIKDGDGAKQIWSVEGSYFTYLGTGFGGTITGIGCNIGIIDDPIKNVKEAYNDNVLESQWAWYTDTFLSRIEEGGMQIINMTRWSTKDLCGRVLESEDAADWYVLKMQACLDEEKGLMLSPTELSFETYMKRKKLTSPAIIEANYQQTPVDIQGALYSGFNTYDAIDPDRFQRSINYTDTADEGADFLASISGGIIDGYIYVTDVYFTDEPMEVTEGETARRLHINNVREVIIESNNGGRGFARNIIAKLKAMKNRKCNITWFHQTKNKKNRILVNSASVQEHIIMPEGWEKKWPAFHKHLMSYQRKGKNEHDDAPDALTGLYEFAIGEVKGKKKAKVLKREWFGI